VGVVALLLSVDTALASAGGPLKEVGFDNSEAARQRGAETVVGVCMMCHSLKYVKFGDLANIGMSKEKIQSLLTDQRLEDRMVSLTPLEVRKESYGKEPPDLSLMAIARKKGPQYIYTLLTSYYTDAAGNADNHLFPGIKMPDMLGYSFAAEGSPERAQIEAQARDTVAFLMWAADPNADARKQLGVYVLVYLVILTALLYLVKRRTWRRVH
jgi:cytochrome c1